MVFARHHGLPARAADGLGDLATVGRHATGPIPASQARRQTCTIIASPAIGARGLSGRRVAASRAG